MTGLAALFGGEAKLMAHVSQWLFEQRYFGCMAIAGNLGAAWAMANYGTRRLSPAAEQAAEQQAYPPVAGSVCRLVTYRPSTNCHLPALRLAPHTLDALRRLGLRRIGDLQHLPRVGLATRLGSELVDRWDQVLGLKQEPIVSLHASPDWSLEQSLEVPTQDSQTIAELLRRLSQPISGEDYPSKTKVPCACCVEWIWFSSLG